MTEKCDHAFEARDEMLRRSPTVACPKCWGTLHVDPEAEDAAREHEAAFRLIFNHDLFYED